MTKANNNKATLTNNAFTATVQGDRSQARNLWNLGEAIAQEIAEAVANGAKAYGYTQEHIVPRLAKLSNVSEGYAQKKTSKAKSMRNAFDTADLAALAATEVKETEEKADPTTEEIANAIVKIINKNKLNARQRKAVLARVEKALA
jgi:DNA-binding ferritin-like protein